MILEGEAIINNTPIRQLRRSTPPPTLISYSHVRILWAGFVYIFPKQTRQRLGEVAKRVQNSCRTTCKRAETAQKNLVLRLFIVLRDQSGVS